MSRQIDVVVNKASVEQSPRIEAWTTAVDAENSFALSSMNLTADQDGDNAPPSGGEESEQETDETVPEKKTEGKKKGKKLKALALNIGCARSSAEVLSLVATNLGWAIHESRAQTDSDIIWVVSDDQIQTHLRRGISSKQHVAKILGMSDVCSKCATASMLRLAEDLTPGASSSFFPRSWVLPQDMAALGEYMEGRSEPLIVKPDEGAQGDGIFIASDYSDLQQRLRGMGGSVQGNAGVLVQRYIEKPMLLGGLKFDLRVYVLVLSLEPLTVLLCREGLARFCTAPYQKPSTKNLHHLTSHLTNYSLNKRSDDFVHTEEGGEGGSKRTISAVFDELEAKGGFGAEVLWERIENMVAETCAVMQPYLLNGLQEAVASDKPPNMRGYDGGDGCFHLLGFDVMLDSDTCPWLLEVNCSPRLAIDQVEPLAKGQMPENPRDVCRCMEDHRPHVHVRCHVDEAVKTAAIGGAMAIVIGSRRGKWGRFADALPALAHYRQVCGPSIGGPVAPSHVTREHVQGGEGGGGLILGLLGIYTKVAGSKRKVDGAKLRSFVREWGAPLALHTVDTLYSTYRSKGRFGFDEFISFLRSMVVKAFPAQDPADSLRHLIEQHLAAS